MGSKSNFGGRRTWTRKGHHCAADWQSSKAPGYDPSFTDDRRSYPGSRQTQRLPRGRSPDPAKLRGCRVVVARIPPSSEVAATFLFPLDGLEQGFEVSFPEAQGPVSFDQLEEDRRPVTDRLGEDLQQVSVLVAVHQNAPPLQLLHRHPDLADPRPELRIGVVRVGCVEKLHSFRPDRVDGAQDVVGGEREVLDARAGVELEVLVDLALLLADSWLVERELDPVVAVGDHLAHQRRIVGGDVVADELGHVGETHDAVVEADPAVHLTELYVPDNMV